MATAGVEVTNACPWRCTTCLPASGLPRRRELATDQMLHLLAVLAAAGYDGVCFSGGEPLGRPDFAVLLRAAVEGGLAVSLFTSGSGLDDRMLAALASTGPEVVLSFDGGDPARHDEIRGDGSFAVASTALRRLTEAGVRVSLACTVTRRNLPALAGVADLAAAHEVSRLTFSEVVRGGRAREHWPSLGLTAADRGRLREWFVEASAGWPGAGTALGVDSSCWVDGRSLYVTAEGRCYVCSEVAQFRPRNLCGQLTGRWDADLALMAQVGRATLTGCTCRYEMVARGSYVLVLDSPQPCVGLDYRPPGVLQPPALSTGRR